MAFREVKSIRFKRIHIRPGEQGKAGHWWFEIGDSLDPDSESFGWWPQEDLSSLLQCFKGVAGQLNDGVSSRDPHHAEDGEEEFSPLVPANDRRTDDNIADCLRDFAKSYEGKWQWFLGWGQNCHNFQRAALEHCGLKVPKNIRRIKL